MGKSRTKYWPEAFVVVVRVAPVSVFLTVMAAPWITASDGSVMIPVIRPVVCAWAAGFESDAKSKKARTGRLRRV